MGNNNDRRLPRLEDVAARAKVSHQTVSRVINNHPNVSAATRSRVEAAIAELGYRRNTAARSLVTRRTQTIGVLASELGQYGPANTLLGVQQAAREAGYFVSIASIKGAGAEAISDAVRHLTDQGADGLIVIVPHDGTLRGAGTPEPGCPGDRRRGCGRGAASAVPWSTRSSGRGLPWPI